MEKIISNKELVLILEYLKLRPYNEVRSLIETLENLPSIDKIVQSLPDLIEE